jgi:hypothetical protein
MKTAAVHPWQSGPAEIVQFALDNIRDSDEVNRRIAFLLLDIGVETLLKTFLTLPETVTKTSLPYAERKRHANGGFHDLVKGVRLTAKVHGIDLNHVEFYHNIRNHLYHEGNGITIRQDYLDGYALTAMTLLKELLAVDLTKSVEFEWLTRQQSPNRELLTNTRKEFVAAIEHLKDLVQLFIERIEPRLIYPSTVAKLKEIATEITVASFPFKLYEFRTLMENNLKNAEMRSWFLRFICEDMYADGSQVISNTEYVMELGRDPISLYLFLIGFFYMPIGDVTKDSVYRDEDITFIDSDEYHIIGVYHSACSWLQYTLTEPYYHGTGASIIEGAQQPLSKLKDINNSLEGIVRANGIVPATGQ